MNSNTKPASIASDPKPGRPLLISAVAAAAIVVVALFWPDASSPAPNAPAIHAPTNVIADPDAAVVPAGAAVAVSDRERLPAAASEPALQRPLVFPTPVANTVAFGGLVVDLEARPVAGLAIDYNGTPFSPPLITGADGRFAGARPAGMGTVGTPDARYVPVLEPVLFDGDQVHADLTLVVAARTRIAGVIVDTEGLPIANAQVQVSLGIALRHRLPRVLDRCVDARFEVMTAADGVFVIERAPAADSARFHVDARGYRRLDLAVARAAVTDHFVLERIVAGDTLTGVVVDETGQPIHPAVVSLHDHSVAVAVDGSFRIDLWRVGDVAAGTMPELTAAAAGRLPGKVACLAPAWRTRGAWPAVLRVQLSGSSDSIRGRVLRHDGSPFPHPAVAFLPPEPEQIVPPTFDAGLLGDAPAAATPAIDGARGEFETPHTRPGRYRLWLCDPTTLDILITEPLSTGPTPVELRWPPGELWPALRGVVVDRRGAIVPGADWIVERDDPLPGATGPRNGGWHNTAADGVIAHPPLSRAVHTLCVKAPGRADWVRIRLADLPSVADFRVVVPVGCQTRIELSAGFRGIDAAGFVDAAGAPSLVVFTHGNVAFGTATIPITEGRSETFVALDDCVELVLYRGGQVAGRVPVALRPEEINVLTP